MDQVIKDLHDTLEKAKVIIKNYEERTNALSVRESNVFERELKVTEQEKTVNQRQAACDKIEDVAALHKEATLLHEHAHRRLKDAQDAENRLKVATDEHHQKVNSARDEIARESAAIEKNRKAVELEVQKRVEKAMESVGFIKDKSGKYVKKG